MIHISDLMHKNLVTKSGKTLGKVTNVILELEQPAKEKLGNLTISQLVYGKEGILELFGLKEVSDEKVPWQEVLKITKDKILVEDNSRRE